jgi:hypothetical protein
MQLHEAKVVPAEITAPLMRAVDRRDMAAREGLVLAVERCVATGRPADEVLKAFADDREADAYARAGLRELATTKAP